MVIDHKKLNKKLSFTDDLFPSFVLFPGVPLWARSRFFFTNPSQSHWFWRNLSGVSLYIHSSPLYPRKSYSDQKDTINSQSVQETHIFMGIIVVNWAKLVLKSPVFCMSINILSPWVFCGRSDLYRQLSFYVRQTCF